jgi:beta-glucanase (GH16 family)
MTGRFRGGAAVLAAGLIIVWGAAGGPARAESGGGALERAGLVQTFGDDFDTFRWYAEGLGRGKTGGGIWRTNYGHGGSTSVRARTLVNNKEQQVYVDPGFRGTGDAPLYLNPFSVKDGVLRITAEKAPPGLRPLIWGRTYTSGLITTKFTFAQRYGVFEMRARLPAGRGLWPAFWLLNKDGAWPPEIDIMEVLGHAPDVLHTTLHTHEGGKRGKYGTGGTRVADTSDGFHVYAVDWSADRIIFYYDDREVFRHATPADMHAPMYILANLAVGGKWPGNPDAATAFPAVMEIDWIRAYRRDAAPAQD